MSTEYDQGLLEKYDVSGPRYTSYPTALQFTPEFGSEDYLRQVIASNQAADPKPLSLYLHIPFCKSLCYYCGCHKVVTQNQNRSSAYLDLLHQEICAQSKLFGTKREVRQIHFGGGTPTYLSTEEIGGLLMAVLSQFTLAERDDREISIEIDPRTTDAEEISTLAILGFNRMSFGIQDFDPEVQMAINRLQEEGETLGLIEAARESGVDSLSVDLIYGLPKQTLEGFRRTLETILSARPDRVALYNYAHMPQLIRAQRLINEKDLPAREVKLALLKLSIDALTDAGYEHIGMDHFALPSDPLTKSLEQGNLHRNFQGYSTHGDCDTIGMGVSAISKIGESFAQNVKLISDYKDRLGQNRMPIERGYGRTRDDSLRAAAIQQLMCRNRLDFQQFEQDYDMGFASYFASELERLAPIAEDGLLSLDEGGIQINQKGRLLLRNIAMVFDAHLQKYSHSQSTTRIETKSLDDNLKRFSRVL